MDFLKLYGDELWLTQKIHSFNFFWYDTCSVFFQCLFLQFPETDNVTLLNFLLHLCRKSFELFKIPDIWTLGTKAIQQIYVFTLFIIIDQNLVICFGFFFFSQDIIQVVKTPRKVPLWLILNIQSPNRSSIPIKSFWNNTLAMLKPSMSSSTYHHRCLKLTCSKFHHIWFPIFYSL